MPNIFMHAQFALDVYDKLDIETKCFLVDQKKNLKTFAQSVDPLFLYDIKKLKRQSRVREFGHYFHKNNTREFFINLINYIKYNDLGHNPETMAFLYGFLSHYILDSTMHPYIYYKTGVFDKNNKDTHKYKSKHHLMEVYLDKYFIKLRKHIKPTKYKFYEDLNTEDFSKELKEMIDITFKETFNVNNMSKFYHQSIINMKKLYKQLRYDPYGIKLFFYRVINKIAPKNIALDFRYVSYYYKENNLEHYLNFDNKKWNYPTHKSKKYHYSIIDLYLQALYKCKNIINQINQYIYYNKKVNLVKLIDNVSYATGIDCDKPQELKYFEF